MARECVYIVGAGFSAGLGYPLTADLLQRLRVEMTKQKPFDYAAFPGLWTGLHREAVALSKAKLRQRRLVARVFPLGLDPQHFLMRQTKRAI
jgi:hypothetical protein